MNMFNFKNFFVYFVNYIEQRQTELYSFVRIVMQACTALCRSRNVKLGQ